MKRTTIAVDIDEVLLAHFQDLINWYNTTYGTRLRLEHNHPTALEPWGTKTIEEAVRRVHGFYDTPTYLLATPFDEAVEAVSRLRREHDLVVITARDLLVEDFTREWLRDHFQGAFKEVHFTAQYSLEGNQRSKADVAREVKATHLIDDDISHAESASRAGIQVLLYGDYPWNRRDVLPEGVTRVRDWQAVMDYFND